MINRTETTKHRIVITSDKMVEIPMKNEEEKEMATATREEIVKKIIDFFAENDDALTECIEELDNYNGYLEDDRYYDMEDLNEFYQGTDPIDILYRAFYGHDDETYTTDEHGEKHYGEFNPNRNYFYYNGYGNLVSADYKDYSSKNDSWLVNALEGDRQYVDSIDNYPELVELFDELENIEEE